MCAACVHGHVYFPVQRLTCMQGTGYRCMCVPVKLVFMLGIILSCSFTLFVEARGFSQTQSSPVWLVRMWLASLASQLALEMAVFPGWTCKWDAMLTSIYVGPGGANGSPLVCIASDLTAKSSSQPGFSVSAYHIPFNLP